MKKNLISAVAAIAFVVLGSATSYAQFLPQQQTQPSLSQQLQQQQFQLQQRTACNTQCRSNFNTCTLNCPAISGAAPVPDPRTNCLNNCNLANASCEQTCTGR
jgi:hypothetical protein